MKNRTVQRLLHAELVDMGGMPVRQPFPTQQVETIDPFLLLHHIEQELPKGIVPHHSGVAPHPHRGFSPVTFIYKGGVHHRDSRGNNSVVYAGGTQWMQAGSGIVHSERPPADIEAQGGVQEIIQLWVNLPKAHKMNQPQYIPLQAEDTPVLALEGGRITVKVVAGQLNDVQGPIKPPTPILALRIQMEPEATYSFPIPEDFNAFLYVLGGEVNLEGYGPVERHQLVLFNLDGAGCTLTARKPTELLLLAGLPLKEPVVSQGPFVMNSQTEILQAMRDYRQGKMGILIED
ncbi:pirin family protein [Pontibacter sp. CAU 1760]